MEFDLTIKNYRCFQKPATISIRNGLISFIGTNNSGKSSLLRFFYECREIFNTLLMATAAGHDSLTDFMKGIYQPFTVANSVFDYEEMFCDCNTNNIEFQIKWNDYPIGSNRSFPAKIDFTVLRRRKNWYAKLSVNNQEYNPNSHGQIQIDNSRRKAHLGNLAQVEFDYFPNLFELLKNTLYIGAYRNILDVGYIDPNNKVDYYDIQIGRTFVEAWRRLKTGSTKRDYNLTKRVTEDIKRIFDFNTLEINPTDDLSTLQVIIDGKSYRLPELGSGIAQFIVVLANAAIRTPSFILIDEPELNLHPSLQNDFLTSLASYSTEGVLFASHSLGLSLGYSDLVYSVRKIEDGTSKVAEYEATPRLSEFLGELSYSGYKELGFDKVLLVEGPTEVKVIQQWLRLYKLSHKIVVIHLGGGSSIHGASDIELNEITRISSNVFALIDSEVDEANKPLPNERKAFLEICNNLGITCKVLERRATENYFTERAIQQALGEKYRALQPYELLKDASPHWNKRDNWRIAREMSVDEIESTDLKDFFQALQTI
jgi:ABC-type cobalamin/Fe3+-siderophores transport system ATPase subunit